MENTSDSENRFSFSKKRSQSSLSDDSESNAYVYTREKDQDEYVPYKSKKKQSGNLKKNIKKAVKKANDDEESGRKGKIGANVGRSMSADSFENKKPASWNGEKIIEKEINSEDEVLTRPVKKQKVQPEEELNKLMNIQCNVSSSSVTTSSSLENANKSKRWIRFACEDHRKKHVKCPENCVNRKTEFVFGNAGNGAE